MSLVTIYCPSNYDNKSIGQRKQQGCMVSIYMNRKLKNSLIGGDSTSNIVY